MEICTHFGTQQYKGENLTHCLLCGRSREQIQAIMDEAEARWQKQQEQWQRMMKSHLGCGVKIDVPHKRG